MKSTVIAIVNQKGGVGKSSTAGALCTGLARRGYKTLLIEFDPQGDDAFSFKADAQETPLLEDLLNGSDLSARIQHTDQGDIIGSDASLAGTDVALDRKYGDSTDKLFVLQKAVKPLKKKYDVVIVDTPPSLGLLSANALCCCDEVIIPARPEVYSLKGIGALNRTINAMKAYNKDLHIAGILLTFFEGRTGLHKNTKATLEAVSDNLGAKVFSASIRKCVDIGNAQDERKDIYSYRPKGNAVQDYNLFIDELLDDLKARGKLQ